MARCFLFQSRQLIETRITVDTTEGPFDITFRAEFDPDVETVINELEQNKYDWVSRRLNALLEAKGISIELDSYEYKALCRDIALAHIDEIHQINVDRDMGNFSDKYYIGIEEGSSGPPEAAPEGLLLSELTTKYLDEKQASPRTVTFQQCCKCSQADRSAIHRYAGREDRGQLGFC